MLWPLSRLLFEKKSQSSSFLPVLSGKKPLQYAYEKESAFAYILDSVPY